MAEGSNVLFLVCLISGNHYCWALYFSRAGFRKPRSITFLSVRGKAVVVYALLHKHDSGIRVAEFSFQMERLFVGTTCICFWDITETLKAFLGAGRGC